MESQRVAADLFDQLSDQRGKRVVFLSHCLLNENTRYPGGACRNGAVREIVEQCLDQGIGIVQMPCPEQRAWGGVGKPLLMNTIGLGRRVPPVRWLRRPLLWLAIQVTRFVYHRLARQVAADIADYQASGFEVIGVVGVDGSPSCGVSVTLAPQRLAGLTQVPKRSLTADRFNALIRRSAVPGAGWFTAALRAELRRRDLSVPFQGHDLFGEIDGRPSNVQIGG